MGLIEEFNKVQENMDKKTPKKPTSEEEKIREAILSDYRSGIDIHDIAMQYNKSDFSVKRTIENFSKRRSFKRRKGAGRHKMLHVADRLSVRNCVQAKPWLTCGEIKRHLTLKASAETIRRYLKDLNYSYKSPKKKPMLSEEDKTERLEWAKNHTNYPFAKVVFVDETSIWLNSSSKRMWIKKGQDYYIDTVPHPQKVNLWGAIGKGGVIAISVYEENLDARGYVSILKESLIPNADDLYGHGRWVLAQDNDSVHTAKVSMDFFRENQVPIFHPYDMFR